MSPVTNQPSAPGPPPPSGQYPENSVAPRMAIRPTSPASGASATSKPSRDGRLTGGLRADWRDRVGAVRGRSTAVRCRAAAGRPSPGAVCWWRANWSPPTPIPTARSPPRPAAPADVCTWAKSSGSSGAVPEVSSRTEDSDRSAPGTPTRWWKKPGAPGITVTRWSCAACERRFGCPAGRGRCRHRPSSTPPPTPTVRASKPMSGSTLAPPTSVERQEGDDPAGEVVHRQYLQHPLAVAQPAGCPTRRSHRPRPGSRGATASRPGPRGPWPAARGPRRRRLRAGRWRAGRWPAGRWPAGRWPAPVVAGSPFVAGWAFVGWSCAACRRAGRPPLRQHVRPEAMGSPWSWSSEMAAIAPTRSAKAPISPRDGPIGTAITPALAAANRATARSAPVGSATTTRSPALTPSARSAATPASAAASSSAQVRLPAVEITAGRSGYRRAADRSRSATLIGWQCRAPGLLTLPFSFTRRPNTRRGGPARGVHRRSTGTGGYADPAQRSVKDDSAA